jgi:hypothetical protein
MQQLKYFICDASIKLQLSRGNHGGFDHDYGTRIASLLFDQFSWQASRLAGHYTGAIEANCSETRFFPPATTCVPTSAKPNRW